MIGTFDFLYSASPESENPVRMSGLLSSGNTPETGSSSVIRPRSTHCIAAMLVMSLVHEAMMKVALRSMGAVGVFGPNAFW